MGAQAFVKVDKATCFQFARVHEGRCEYVRGRIMMQQSGGSRRHSLIAKRFLVLLDRQLDPPSGKRWALIWLSMSAKPSVIRMCWSNPWELSQRD
jgi:hypothetical protein